MTDRLAGLFILSFSAMTVLLYIGLLQIVQAIKEAEA